MLWWWLALAGCRPTFTNVEDACDPGFRNDSSATDGAQELFDRVNCYRRLVKLTKVVFDPTVQAAAAAHEQYMLKNKSLTIDETAGDEDFTGETVADRLIAAGYGQSGVQIEEIASQSTLAPADIVDAAMDDVYLRQLVLQPSLAGVGFAQAPHKGYLEWIDTYYVPSGERYGRPIVYPAPNQTDVPTSTYTQGYGIGAPDDGIPDGRLVGYPISVTLGASQLGADPTNQYGFSAATATLTGPDGDQPLYTLIPGPSADLVLVQSAVFVPEAALADDTDYQFTASITDNDGTFTVDETFHTAPATP